MPLAWSVGVSKDQLFSVKVVPNDVSNDILIQEVLLKYDYLVVDWLLGRSWEKRGFVFGESSLHRVVQEDQMVGPVHCEQSES